LFSLDHTTNQSAHQQGGTRIMSIDRTIVEGNRAATSRLYASVAHIDASLHRHVHLDKSEDTLDTL
jgi:hypothetical protein